MKRNADFENLNPFRPPHWRWQRIESLARRFPSPGRCSSRDDAWVRLGRSFLCRWSGASSEEQREQILWERPGPAYAYAVHERRTTNPSTALFLEARLLAGQTFEYIANEMSTMPDTVACYAALFFDVVEHLKNRDWITSTVLLPPIINHLAGFASTQEAPEHETAADRHRRVSNIIPVALPFLDASLKYFAYFGGPVLVDTMIHGIVSGRPVSSQDDLSRWLDETWALTVKRRSLQATGQVEINKYNAMELLTVHSRIMEIEKGDDSQESRRSTLERHIKAMLDDLPYRIGPQEVTDEMPYLKYQNTPGELRDDEINLPDAEIPVAEIMRPLPPPRKRQGQPPASDQQADFV